LMANLNTMQVSVHPAHSTPLPGGSDFPARKVVPNTQK
jgi:hypothetical protein